jgi:branched-chain amino acid transport system permease protein
VAWLAAILVALYQLKQGGLFRFLEAPSRAVGEAVSAAAGRVPRWLSLSLLLACAIAFPFFTERYAHDVAISVLVYIMLGLGLNIVVGFSGLLDLGYIAFFGVGAYTYALLSVHFELSFCCACISACFFGHPGCIIGYPTLRLRGDNLAIVLGIRRIVRISLNKLDEHHQRSNGVLGIKSPGALLVQGRKLRAHLAGTIWSTVLRHPGGWPCSPSWPCTASTIRAFGPAPSRPCARPDRRRLMA